MGGVKWGGDGGPVELRQLHVHSAEGLTASGCLQKKPRYFQPRRL